MHLEAMLLWWSLRKQWIWRRQGHTGGMAARHLSTPGRCACITVRIVPALIPSSAGFTVSAAEYVHMFQNECVHMFQTVLLILADGGCCHPLGFIWHHTGHPHHDISFFASVYDCHSFYRCGLLLTRCGNCAVPLDLPDRHHGPHLHSHDGRGSSRDVL